MNMKLSLAPAIMLSFAMFACSDNNVAGSTEDPNVVTAEEAQSSSLDSELSSSYFELSSSTMETTESSSSVELSSSSFGLHVLCKVNGDWGYNGCIRKEAWGRGDLWSPGDNKVKTDAYAEDPSKFGDRAGEFFFEKDSADRRDAVLRWNDPKTRYDVFSGSLDGIIAFDRTYTSFVKIGFYTAGFDSNGTLLSADISNWNGICVLYQSTIGSTLELTLQLDLGDSINRELGYALPSVVLESKKEPQCFEWKDFKSPASDKENKIISGEDAAKHVEKIIFYFQIFRQEVYTGSEGFEILAIGTNRDE